MFALLSIKRLINKLPMFAINKLNKTNSATNKMVESVCILRLFWLFDTAKIVQ